MITKRIKKVVNNVTTYFTEFISVEALSGIILFACSALAMIMSNTAFEPTFHHFWHTHISFSIESLHFDKSLDHWINDGWMAVFFFVIGLEIKREFLFGQLSSPGKIMLPVLAAFGGAVLPALIFTFFNHGTPMQAGWGIPMATDIAFVVGIMALLGDRIPAGLKTFILAFAIIDDLIAIIVIAIFYTATINWMALLIAGIVLLIAIILNYFRLYNNVLFLLLGVIMWAAFVKSGVHATIAGVLMALCIPSEVKVNKKAFVGQAKELLDRIDEHVHEENTEEGRLGISMLEGLSRRTESPMHRLELLLHPISSFIIIPVFALANAGITFNGSFSEMIANKASLGIVSGLFIGKQVGIFLTVWLVTKLKIARLPENTGWKDVYGAACLAGMGFTMSLFITFLAYSSDALADSAKFGIVFGSLISALAGIIVFNINNKRAIKE